jgi:hypothetical protein
MKMEETKVHGSKIKLFPSSQTKFKNCQCSICTANYYLKSLDNGCKYTCKGHDDFSTLMKAKMCGIFETRHSKIFETSAKKMGH